jgi:hypothetical protein
MRQRCFGAVTPVVYRGGFKWDCHVLTLDTVNGEIPF